VLAILGLAVLFTSTFAFQVGLIGHLLRQFSATILVALLCLVLSILLHFFSLRDRWSSQEEDETVAAHRSYQSWQTGVTILFVLQRTGKCRKMRRFNYEGIFYPISIRLALLSLQEDHHDADRPEIPSGIRVALTKDWQTYGKASSRLNGGYGYG
jgi:hypothetical protein